MSVKSLSDKSLVLSPEIRIAKKYPPPDLKPLKIVPCKICRHKSNESSPIVEEFRCNGFEGLTWFSSDGMHSKSVVDPGSPLAQGVKVVNEVRSSMGEEIVQMQSSTEEDQSNEVAVDQESTGQISKDAYTLAAADIPAQAVSTVQVVEPRPQWPLGGLVLSLTGLAVNQFSSMPLEEYKAQMDLQESLFMPLEEYEAQKKFTQCLLKDVTLTCTSDPNACFRA